MTKSDRTSERIGLVLVGLQIALGLAVALGPWIDGGGGGANWRSVEIAYALGALAFIILVLAFRELGSNLTPFPKPRVSGRLVTTGIFALSRNPIYLGMLCLAIAWSIGFGSRTAIVATCALAVLLDVKIRAEERFLRERFGQEYESYRKRVRRVLPYVW